MNDFETNLIFNDETLTWSFSDKINIPNRAMNFGDGLFESMVFCKSKVRYSEKHLDRLKNGFSILGFPFENIDIELIEKTLKKNFPPGDLRVRWNLFRSGSGTYTPSTNRLIQTLQIKKFSPPPRIKKTAFICTRIKIFPTIWSNAKTLNSLPYVLANIERTDLKMDEVIILDNRGFISEAGSSNIFWMIGEEVFTPSLNSSCIAGVGRAVIIESLKNLGMEITEGLFFPEHLAKATTVWVSNAMGISYLENIEGVEYSTKTLPFLEKLFN
ncbi:aminotransferase class IV [Algoriphagus sp.]|uniref:aminotransferase class IV n=1 Tax=Algoriphagus sp. TaxID=1872435 RepID=UPI0025F659C6|nr:aminotransferase class IV [Algoriphagus sp.]